MTNVKPAFVFVHGFWHSAATWRLVLPLLEARGYIARAIDLPGAGVHANFPVAYNKRPLDATVFTEPSPNAAVTQKERTSAVVSLIEEMASETGGSMVLVGHSMGGVTVSAVAEAVPHHLHAIVYLTAFMLPDGMPAIAMIQHELMANSLVPSLFLADPEAVGALRIDPRSNDADYRERMRTAFYGDVSEADFTSALTSLHCDEPVGAVVTPVAITAPRFGRLPRHYVRCMEDKAILPQGQDFMIAAVDVALGSRTQSRMLTASHSPFYSQPHALAEILLGIVEQVV